MKPICGFEWFDPPVLNEKMLHRELEKRAERRRTVLLAIAGALMQIAALLLAVLVRAWYPALSLALVCTVILSATGGGVIAIVYTQKGGKGCDAYT